MGSGKWASLAPDREQVPQRFTLDHSCGHQAAALFLALQSEAFRSWNFKLTGQRTWPFNAFHGTASSDKPLHVAQGFGLSFVGQPPQLWMRREISAGMPIVQGCQCHKDNPPHASARAGTGTQLWAERSKDAKVWQWDREQSIGRRPEFSAAKSVLVGTQDFRNVRRSGALQTRPAKGRRTPGRRRSAGWPRSGASENWMPKEEEDTERSQPQPTPNDSP